VERYPSDEIPIRVHDAGHAAAVDLPAGDGAGVAELPPDWLTVAMIDHTGFGVSDYQRSKAFYERALAPLGITLLMEPMGAAAGFGEGRKPFFWIEAERSASTTVHVAFEAPDRPTVDAFHAAALEAGGTDNGAPGVREIYHPDYYGAYVLDLDGNNIEAVCHKPA
jgi:catechol 2,3-dioxygenase-like lactoylglutathione lyase family enzyme